MIDPNDKEFADQIMRSIAALRGQQQHDAILLLIADIIVGLNDVELPRFKEQIVDEFPESLRPQIVDAALDLIDGQIALRAILK